MVLELDASTPCNRLSTRAFTLDDLYCSGTLNMWHWQPPSQPSPICISYSCTVYMHYVGWKPHINLININVHHHYH